MSSDTNKKHSRKLDTAYDSFFLWFLKTSTLESHSKNLDISRQYFKPTILNLAKPNHMKKSAITLILVSAFAVITATAQQNDKAQVERPQTWKEKAAARLKPVTTEQKNTPHPSAL